MLLPHFAMRASAADAVELMTLLVSYILGMKAAYAYIRFIIFR